MSRVIGLNKIAKDALADIEIDVKRSYRTEFIAAGINVRLALLMIKIANIQKDENVLDPFCGSGVIPIECALQNLGNKIFGSDILGNAIKKSIVNATNSGIGKQVKFFQSDVKNIRLPHGLINVIITNLPFGIRVGTHHYNEEIYLKLYNKTKKLLAPNGRLIILTQEKKLIESLFTKDKLYKINNIYEVDSGGLSPNIYEFIKLI